MFKDVCKHVYVCVCVCVLVFCVSVSVFYCHHASFLYVTEENQKVAALSLCLQKKKALD